MASGHTHLVVLVAGLSFMVIVREASAQPMPATTRSDKPTVARMSEREQGPRAKLSEEAIAQLVRQLGSPTFKKRESANEALAALEEDALDALRKAAAADTDAEIRRRAKALVETVESWMTHPVRTFHGHTSQVERVTFSPDGHLALSAGAYDGSVRLWNVKTGKEFRRFLLTPGEYVSSAVFSPDGRQILTADWGNHVRLWDLQTGRQVRCFRGHSSLVYCAEFSPDGRQALSGSLDYTVRLWDVMAGKEIRCLKEHKAQIWCVAFSRDGRLALSGGADGTARLWDLETGKELRCLRIGSSVQGIAFLPNQRRFVAAVSDVIICDLETGKEVHRFEGHQAGIIYGLALSKDGTRILSGSDDKSVRLWDVATGKELIRYVQHSDGIRSVALSPDGTLALSGSVDTSMCLWKMPR